jgi:hypothetical protein
MDTKTRTILLWSGVAVLVVAGIVTLFIAFSGSMDTAANDVNAIYTNAAATVAAQQQTLQAGTFVATPTPTFVLPTLALSPLPSPTQQQTPILLPTIPPATVVVTGCDNSVYVSDVTIPDGTVIAPGQTFVKTWRLSNTGSCAWTATYKLIFISGEKMSGKETAIGKIVKPGETADISVELISPPASTSSITGWWRLSNDKGLPFGQSITVVIKSGTTGTATPTPTATVGAATATPTLTATPTPTPTPTTSGYPNP